MTTYLTYVDGTSAKFWQISVDGCSHTVTFGKIGTTGQSKTKTFDDETACQKDAEKLIKAKKAKGYSEDGTPVQPSTSKPNQKNNTDKTAIFAEFDDIIKNGDLNQIVPFLNAHKNGNVSELKKRLNKARHYYFEYKNFSTDGGWDYNYVGKPYQFKTIWCFACALLSPSDYNNNWYNVFFICVNNYRIIDDKELLSILKNFNAKALFNIFFNQVVSDDNQNLSYPSLQQLEKYDLIDYHAPIFSKSLSNHYLYFDKKITLEEYRSAFLMQDIPSRDLKSLFEYETNIDWSCFYGIKDDRLTGQGGEPWLYLIPEFIKQGKLEREWVLQKCIEIQSNFWKQTTKKFYKDLFKALNPTEQELLNLQDSLFMLLQHELKPTVNFALDSLKPLIHHQAFNFAEFMTFIAPMMMNGEFKSSIKSLLTQFDKILKTHPQHMALIYPSLCHVLFINDLALQEKAVKLLVKYANQDILGDEWENLISHIETLFDSLPNDIKTLLAPLYQTQDEINESKTEHIVQNLLSDMTYQYDPVVRIDYFADDKKIELYSEFNDILFNVQQLISTKNPIDIEIFMESWLKLKSNNQLPKDYLEHIKPILEQYRKSWYYNRAFNAFKAEFLNDIFQNNDEKYEHYDKSRDYKIINSYKAMIPQFIRLNQHNPNLSLLSMPTHFPAFIEPKVLVERLISYQDANETINLTDYAVALARMPRVNIEPAIELLSEIKDVLIIESLKFAFGVTEIGETIPPKYITELFGNNKDEDYQAWRGIFATIAKTHYPYIELDYQHSESYLFDRVIKNDLIGSDYHYKKIYEYKEKNGKYAHIEAGQEVTFQMKEYFNLAHTTNLYRQVCYYSELCPDWEDHYNLLLPKYLMTINQIDYDKFLSTYIFYNETVHPKLALPILERLMSEDYPYNAYTQFILVACLFAKDKAVRLAGIDAVIFAISHFKLDPNMFAQHSSQWIQHFSAPFSRYVECITQLSQYESIYQKVLLEIIEKTIIQIEFKDKLPTNFKKYLEIYYLLLSSLNKKADNNVIDKLQQWLVISGSIKTIVGKIGKL